MKAGTSGRSCEECCALVGTQIFLLKPSQLGNRPRAACTSKVKKGKACWCSLRPQGWEFWRVFLKGRMCAWLSTLVVVCFVFEERKSLGSTLGFLIPWLWHFVWLSCRVNCVHCSCLVRFNLIRRSCCIYLLVLSARQCPTLHSTFELA